MKNINWRVRVRNKLFWQAIVPAFLLLIQAIAMVFGWEIDLSTLSGKLLAVVDAAFAVLVLLGIVNDPTTEGLADSELAKTYDEPKPKG